MSEYHEPAEELSAETRDLHRAMKSLIEEIEAVDWYNQRVQLTKDPELKKILEHNRDEEIEHACMSLEWLRRKVPAWDEELKTYLFTEGPITEIEHGATGGGAKKTDRSLGVGSLKKTSPES
jgi:ferritin-like protein